MTLSKASSGEGQRALLVLGPHRSGTSVVASCLQSMGANLGHGLLEPNVDNPKGFFENEKIVSFNDYLLKQLGLCWDYFGAWPAVRADSSAVESWIAAAAELVQSEFDGRPLIAIKDPRMCLLADIWTSALDRCAYVIDYVLVLRSPTEAAKSQATRLERNPRFHFIGGDLDEGLLLWTSYMHAALTHLKGKRFCVAPYEDFIESPARAITELGRSCGLPLDDQSATSFISSFIDPELRRSVLENSEAASLPAMARELEALYEQLLTNTSDSTIREEIQSAALVSLQRALTDPESLARCVSRCYVRARHAAIESNLELAEAKRIIAFQEHLIEVNKKQQYQSELIQTEGQHRLVALQREVERLSLLLAARDDQKSQTR